ncbi:GNAT family N-acetyltransferase [Candidatus Leptofilum sp.]|uniref:GNAT family N-acetyltransferase n=1 Tax=Candidatus Leptofilum sp. TaxID=3241576 RepID=UPI003B5B0868
MEKVQIRRAVPDDADRMAHCLVAGNRASFDGLVPEKCLDFPVEESSRNWRQTLVENETSHIWLLLVAEYEAGLVVGYAMFGTGSRQSEFGSELLSMAVDPNWQQRGIGRLLVQRGAAFYQKQGIHSMLVGVLEINPNVAFYERLGAKYVEERPYNWDGFETTELLYGWANLEMLANLRGRGR